ncbi:ABC transporter permease [Paraburkholderia antibiotica]|uniref:ABC transporter permease n=1 Tax=Paraburkholderia antibiotica TaxID=2728839 RepID=A0A7X9X748_9BURK|nr:ABC transporter permease [Paraburkholderia antibiotica]NML32314.1 ABC transporter permease [Paraburkholderia antibiotica]
MKGMIGLTVQRIGLGIATLFVVSVLIFSAIQAMPGDLAQAVLGQSATPEALTAFRKDLNLDEPPVKRYGDWIGAAVTGHFGKSLADGRDISQLIGPRLANTLFLATFAALIAIPLSLLLGFLAALYRNSWFDRLINVITLTSISFPEFFIAYILIFALAQGGYFSSISDVGSSTPFWEHVHATFLPALTLTLVVVAHMMRMTRAAIINVLAAPYIEMARLKGVPRWKIVLNHALPNALAPVINVVALNLAYLIVGVVVVEVVFVYPGLGQLLVDSVAKRDVTVVQAVGLIFAATYILLNLVADLLVTVSNPRLRYRR